MVELAMNDKRDASTTSLQRRTYERLLRRILSQPSQPALALVNYYAWLLAAGDGKRQGLFYGGPEPQFNELAQVRLNAGCWLLAGSGQRHAQRPVGVPAVQLRSGCSLLPP